MVWWIFIICGLRIYFSTPHSSSEFTISPLLNNGCLFYLKWKDLPEIYNGLICGSKNIGKSNELLFIATGLYHLIVISGSHLLFIDNLFKKILNRHIFLRILILFLFSFMCLFNAPVTRALLGYCIRYISKNCFLYLREDQLILISGLVTLILFPSWITSISLQLSWLTALCMTLPLKKSIKCFICLFYVAPILGAQNPLVGFNNILFVGLFDLVLFPFTMITLILPYSSPVAHFIWDIVLLILQYLPTTNKEFVDLENHSLFWHFIFMIQLFHFWIRK